MKCAKQESIFVAMGLGEEIA